MMQPPCNTKSFSTQSNPSLEEVAKARPSRGNGAPSRTRSHYARILTLLRERGPAGVLSSELYDNPQLYGRSPRNRVSEMRQEGCLIETVPAGTSVVRYVLIRDANGAPPTQNPPRPKSRDWYERATGKPRTAVVPEKSTTDDLPLFDLAVR